MAPTLADRFTRPLRDLRISVTDRCNFRCPYCMPKEVFGREFGFLPRREILSYEEVFRLASIFHQLGARKMRITGGEPLLRRDLPRLIALLRNLPEVDLALTTNGALLSEQASALAEAGLDRVTVSLDSLDDEVFRRMNDVDFPVGRVLAGIEAAKAAGLAPIKINCVVRRGLNEDSIVSLARHFRFSGHPVRFIEYMDVGTTNGWSLEHVVPASEVRSRLEALGRLEPVAPSEPGEVARRFRWADGGGEIGLIASVSQPFCASCTRARLSTDGKLFTCLFASQGLDLRGPLRRGASDESLRDLIKTSWRGRDDRYSELRSEETAPSGRVEMSYIGG